MAKGKSLRDLGAPKPAARGAGGPPHREGKRGVVLYLDPEEHRSLKILAAEQDTTLHQLLVDAIRDRYLA